MKIGFIGAGKVGTVVGWYFKSKGLDVLGYHGRAVESAKQAAQNTQTSILTLGEVVKKSEILFITTPDRVIEWVVNHISEEIGFRKNQTVVHMSGALKSSILEKANNQGANIFSLHPMQAFADFEESKKDMENTFFTYEGVGDDTHILAILNRLGNPYTKIEPNHKSLYHAAACISSNYLVTLTSVAVETFNNIGFTEEESINVLIPLMKGTLQNIEDLGIDKALTGPIIRGDSRTIEGHLQKLKDYKNLNTIYCNLGNETLKIAKRRGLSEENISSIREILKKNT